MCPRASLWTLLTSALLLLNTTPALGKTFRERVLERSKRGQAQFQAHVARSELQEREAEAKFRYLNANTKPYRVKNLPDVNFDIGEMYSGSIPIASNDTTRNLFFIFQPTIGDQVDDLTIWLNGGPGCSSLDGFFQENGRFLWQPGTFLPVENPYSWVNLTNMLWVDQPVGTGFSTGAITATSQYDTAADFVKWLKNFQTLFGIKNYRIFVTGESYAGRYVPYISSAILNQSDPTHFNLQGALVYDPCIGAFTYTQEQVPAVPFVLQNNNLFNFNQTFLNTLEQLDQTCGYASYREQYMSFPPKAMQPIAPTVNRNCSVFSMIENAAFDPNPCFDIYEVNQMCPLLWDVLSFPTSLTYTPEGATTYFNRTDVKKALHAPNINWAICGEHTVFVGRGGPEGEGDLAPDPIQQVLPQVIEATNRVLVGNGDYDMIILTNGTLMSIQNMTWNGQMGFQTQPQTPIIITEPDLLYPALFHNNGRDGPQGTMGVQHFERGLMWVETFQSGHMQPEFQPRVALRHLEWLLGYRSSI